MPTEVPSYKWAKIVKDLDGMACAVCGSTKRLEAHHIERRCDSPEKVKYIENGVCLCFKCHRTLHGGWGMDWENVRKISAVCEESASMSALLFDLPKEQADAFREYCKARNTTPNGELRAYVLGCIGEKEAGE